MASRTISTTKNYRMFKVSKENRPLDLRKRKKLRDSMKEYGFLKSFPISCFRNGAKHLVVKDGQNRLAIAEELGLHVHYFVEDVDYDIATVNNAQQAWSIRDYATKWASLGNEDYSRALEFAESQSMPLTTALGLLRGNAGFNGDSLQAFRKGKYKITEYEFAERVGSAYTVLTSMSSEIKNRHFLSALIAAFRVEGFSVSRLIEGAKKRSDRLRAYSTRDAYLDMIEELYNYNRVKLVPIKMPAIQVMRERDAVKK